MRQRQSDFFRNNADLRPHRISHGGSLAVGRRKLSRPLDRRKPIHVVMKSSASQGRLSLLSSWNKLEVKRIIKEKGSKCGVTIVEFQNMGNHLHLLLKFHDRDGLQNFLRSAAALIARFVTGARRGKPFGKKFWDQLVFTRVITGRRDFINVLNYFFKNQVERDVSSFGRLAIELHEKAERIARRRGCDVWQVLDDWNQKARGKNESSDCSS